MQRYAREIVPAFNAYVYFRIGYWIGKQRLARACTACASATPTTPALEAIPRTRRGLRHEPPQQHGLHHRRLPRRRARRARTRWASGRGVGAAAAHPRDGRLLRAPQFQGRRSTAACSSATSPWPRRPACTQAVYPEGGLTRDGADAEPRFGVLDYMLRGYTREGERDLVFVPLGLNYDRVLEDRTQLRAGDAGGAPAGGLRGAGTRSRFVGAASRAAAAQPLASVRLRLRQLRHAGVGARVAGARGIRARPLPTRASAKPRWRRWAGI